MFLATELMIQGAVVTAVGFGRYHGQLAGQAFALFLLIIAAVEAALGLGLVVLMFRRSGSLDAEAWRTMKETE
jgi:NADH-quinone oxidoreductase subunit K